MYCIQKKYDHEGQKNDADRQDKRSNRQGNASLGNLANLLLGFELGRSKFFGRQSSHIVKNPAHQLKHGFVMVAVW